MKVEGAQGIKVVWRLKTFYFLVMKIICSLIYVYKNHIHAYIKELYVCVCERHKVIWS